MNASTTRKALGQYMTPQWAADELADRFLGDLTSSDCVMDPSCGDAAFLCAVPSRVPAFGVDIDPVMAQSARTASGRVIVVGDFRTVALPRAVTHVIGNPPFKMSVFDDMLCRIHQLLPDGGRAGFILPSYTFQTPSRTCRYNEHWSLQADHLPRTLFPGLSKPLVFAIFQKCRARTMIGFTLYREAYAIESLSKPMRELVAARGEGVWARAVRQALHLLGGEADLREIYKVMSNARPTETQWWKEKVRQTVMSAFQKVGPSRYALGGERLIAA